MKNFFVQCVIYVRTLEFRVDFFLSRQKINKQINRIKIFVERQTHYFFWHVTGNGSLFLLTLPQSI